MYISKRRQRSITEDAEAKQLTLNRFGKNWAAHVAVRTVIARHKEWLGDRAPEITEETLEHLTGKLRRRQPLQQELPLAVDRKSPVRLKKRPPPLLIFEQQELW